ncbi:hypothetical protein NDU88_007836 [Pleurodeles waltl]|uniref:Uncharacterized protein n=1 Tax=Pleurodeles waltl TaxID=8319 RepID=A0AAV7STY2_PLEWA|nr:hypothetical protein NDU88_007836 [Pleurodeles waltl]
MQLVTSRTILMVGDFNCTVELDGRTGSDSAGMDLTSRQLVEMTDVNSTSERGCCVVTDHPIRVEDGGPSPEGDRRARLSAETRYQTSPRSGPMPPAAGKTRCRPEEAALRVAYVEWRDTRDLFHSAGEWWEWVKDRFRSFFQDACRAAAREKKSKFRQLQSKLQRLFELKIRGWDVDDKLKETRIGLAEHYREESREIIFWTRTENLEKDEKCNSFFKKLHSAHARL